MTFQCKSNKEILLPFFSGNPALKSQNQCDGQNHKNSALQSALWRGVTLIKGRNCRICQGKNFVDIPSSKILFGELCCGGISCRLLLIGLDFNWTSIAHVSPQNNLQYHPHL